MRTSCCLACAGLLLLLLLSPGTASAQLMLVPDDTPRFELGGQVMLLQYRQFGSLPRDTNIAGGARFTVNLSRWFAVESQFDVFPQDTFVGGLRSVQALFGFKAGIRGRWGGVFGTFRPGLLYHWQELTCGIPEGCDDWRHDGHRDVRGESWFAVNAGGGAELYPSRRVVARFDVGDTFVRRWDHVDATGRAVYFTSHNLQTSVGMGVRF